MALVKIKCFLTFGKDRAIEAAIDSVQQIELEEIANVRVLEDMKGEAFLSIKMSNGTEHQVDLPAS